MERADQLQMTALGRDVTIDPRRILVEGKHACGKRSGEKLLEAIGEESPALAIWHHAKTEADFRRLATRSPWERFVLLSLAINAFIFYVCIQDATTTD